MAEWIEVDGAENMPMGKYLVTTQERGGREKDVHVAKVRKNVIIVGQHFHFDMPKVVAYMDAPEPYLESK